jgi:3-hydroxyisobutyrate dehydrogenase
MNVTILGAGNMGAAMAARLIDTGEHVTIWNRTADRAQHLHGIGITVEPDLHSAVAGASVVITMVTNGDAVHTIADQMRPAMRPDAVWVQASTVGAEWADRLRELAKARRRTMLDAPVSGSTGPARNGTLSWLVAGPNAAIDAARPVLDSLGERVLVVGTRQEASRLKLIVNTWMTAATVAMADVLAACDQLGIARSALLEVVGTGPLAMPYTLQKAQLMTDGTTPRGSRSNSPSKTFGSRSKPNAFSSHSCAPSQTGSNGPSTPATPATTLPLSRRSTNERDARQGTAEHPAAAARP